VPVGEIFRRMPFVVRDLARSMGKRVELQLLGQGTEIDKYVIERMMDPVLHLVRNSVTHGIETPEERIAAGKSPEGILTLSASTAGDVVTIEIADDGRGIDAEAVAARARSVGIPVPAQLDAAALLAIICSPGFSTREESDRGAGRGVGMGVVKTTAEQLSGTVSLETQPGAGTRFTISLPLTLAITDALIVRVGSETFAVPQGAVREVLEVSESAVNAFERHEMIPYRDGALPIVRLARLFGIDSASRPDRFHLFVVGYSSNAVGVVVDRIIGQREVVVRSSAGPRVRGGGI
jgi:two-component system chemotaxis sensor kinase CheA